MKVKGKLEGEHVTVLIDSRVTHNFTSNELGSKRSGKWRDTKGYQIFMSNGIKVQGKGICRRSMLQLCKFKVVENYIPMESSNYDVILGVA